MGWFDAILCPLAMLAERYGATMLIGVISGIAAGGVLGSSVVRWLGKFAKIGTGSLATGWVAAALISLGVYLFARLVDPLLMSTVDAPNTLSPDDWDRLGFFEWKLLGDWAWPILPLSEHPPAGLALHFVVWGAMIVLVRAVLLWIYREPHTPPRWFLHGLFG